MWTHIVTYNDLNTYYVVIATTKLLTYIRTFIFILIGFLLQFLFFCFLGFWCFHLFHLFFCLAFPLKAKQWMESRKIRIKLHITESLAVIACGLVFPTVTKIVSNYQIANFGVFCLPQPASVTFYGQVVPYLIAFIIGLSLLLCSLWILYKVSSIFCVCYYSHITICMHVQIKGKQSAMREAMRTKI